MGRPPTARELKALIDVVVICDFLERASEISLSALTISALLNLWERAAGPAALRTSCPNYWPPPRALACNVFGDFKSLIKLSKQFWSRA